MRPAVSNLAALLVMVAPTACATAPRPRPATSAQSLGETISVAIGPCFGFCPVYSASVEPGGLVRFDGQRNTAVLGQRTRNLGKAGYREIARDLAPFHPAAGTDAVIDCTAAVSDTSPFTVTWSDPSGRKTTATVQSGCPGGPGQALVRVLRGLPDRLGIADWTRQTTRPGTSRG